MIALAAMLTAIGVLVFSGPNLTAIDWSVYDRWSRKPASTSVSPDVVIVARDPASERRFGSSTWDRAVLARVITNLSRAGASAIGIDVPLEEPGAPGRGGAASDALLSQAIGLAGNVVSATPGASARPRLGERSRAVGHTHVAADPDGVVRRAPILIRAEDRAVPALGLALAAVHANARVEEIAVAGRWVTMPRGHRIPIDGRGQALIRYAEPGRLTVLSFVDVWAAIDSRSDALPRLVGDKIVLVLAEPARELRPTPVGLMSDGAIQAQVLNAVMTGSWLRELGLGWALVMMSAAAAMTAWIVLTLQRWTGLAAVTAFGCAYAAALVVSPALTGVMLPIVVPLGAVVAAAAASLLWNQVGAAHQVERLETELREAREALVRQESMVETLEEDLGERVETSDALRARLAEAQRQEEATRHRLHELERELRAADARPAELDDAEQERLRRRCAELGITTHDPAMLALFRDVEKAARSSLPILIAGEPGTGKELFARAAHRLSARAAGPFVAVNMAAIPAELFEGELFGHVKGSFTGAIGDRKGYFEQADGGTIFLDEIGELRAEHQGKLLRVLQEKSFYRVGATRPTAVDARIVAASNRDLQRGIAEGWFREDLYFRLKGLVLRLPPLRERRADIPALAARFLEEAATEAGRRASLSEAALLALERYDWPGNVRELQHCLRQAIALADRKVLTPEDLRLPAPVDARTDGAGDAAVLACLRQHGFDMQATARTLGWDRSTVTQRLKGLGFRALVEAGGDRRHAAATLAGDPALGHAVEVKLAEYHQHLLRAVAGFPSADAAIAACRRRFKNLPDRHFRFLELLVRQHFERGA